MPKLIVVNDANKKRIIKNLSKQKALSLDKVIGYNEFIRKFYFDYQKNAVVYTMEKYHVSKEIAEIYLSNLYFIQETNSSLFKINLLQNLKKELKAKGLLIKSLCWKEKLKEQELEFYHITNQDKFFERLMNECRKITKVNIINWPNEEQSNHIYEIEEYKNTKEEVIGICHQIYELLKKGVKPTKIFIANLTENYRNLFDFYGTIFKIPFNLKKKHDLISTPIINEFKKNIELPLEENIENLTTKYQKDQELEILKTLIKICDQYYFVSEDKFKKELILEELKNTLIKENTSQNSIQEIDFAMEELDKDSYLFVIGCYEGNFPIFQKDENFLTDIERKFLNSDLIKDINSLHKKEYITKIKSFKNIKFSYARKDGKEDLYPASILEAIPHNTKKIATEYYQMSHLYNKINYATKLDTLRKYGTKDSNLDILSSTYSDTPYLGYQNKFQQFKNCTLKKRLSYSSLDTFFHCSFRYYLDNILQIAPYEESFAKQIGILFHQIIKESYQNNFDFEQSWQKNISNVITTDAKEKFFFKKLKKDLQRIINTIKEQEKDKNFQVLNEKELLITFDSNPEYSLVGILDKILYYEENNQTHIAVIDYKTGNPNLNWDSISYGLNMQLPIYLLLIQNLSLSNIKPIGFYFQKILPTIPEQDKIHTAEELKKKKHKLQGYSIDEEDILKVFDKTYENSNLISRLKKSSKGFYSYSKVLSHESFEKIKALTKAKIEEAIEELENRNFKINPKRIGPDLIGCDYCPYKDICYCTESDVENLKYQKLTEVLGGEKLANMDERAE